MTRFSLGKRLFGRVVAAMVVAVAGPACAANVDAPSPPTVRLIGQPTVAFDPSRDGCDGSDVPDAPARAFRRADGAIVLFGLHYTNHPLIGSDIGALKVSCHSAYQSHENADPAAYDDRSWIAAAWTADGTHVDGLLHHEYQANEHAGRCRFPTYMQCWFNAVVGVRSDDGGIGFAKPPADAVVAAAPFRQEVEQGRHRGFFNPSNIVSHGAFLYMMASTTGWTGQEGGVCLFRTKTPRAPNAWRAFDGTGFTTRFGDPYRGGARTNRAGTCQVIAPFPAPVGSLVRLRGSGQWLAVFQAKADVGAFPVSGFYVAASRDLLHWSAPRLLLAGATNYDDPCRAKDAVLAYPSLIDPDASGRNFDNAGANAILFFARSKVAGCDITGDRVLLRQPVSIMAGG